MPREKITRRQKNISRLLRERRHLHRDRLKSKRRKSAKQQFKQACRREDNWRS